MMNRIHRQRIFTLGAVSLIVSSAVAIAIYALRDNINLYYTPSQCQTTPLKSTQLIRVGGMVVKNSVARNPKTLAVSFDLTDFKHTIRVQYQGILPDLFREGQGIVAMGHWMPTGYLQATEVLAKHDENYMPPEVASLSQKG